MVNLNFKYYIKLVSVLIMSITFHSCTESDSGCENFENKNGLNHINSVNGGKIIFYTKDCQYHGTYLKVSSNNTMSCIGEYKNGNKNGRWLYYDENLGALKYEIQYDNGVVKDSVMYSISW